MIGKTLGHYQITTPVTSYFAHSSTRKTQSLLTQIRDGSSIALISEAGTPSISDPGYVLTRLAIDRQIAVVPIPGPAALIAALSVSGLSTRSFIFEGFLPRKAGRRKNLFLALRDQQRDDRPGHRGCEPWWYWWPLTRSWKGFRCISH